MTMIVLGEVATGMGVARNLEDSGANLNQVRHSSHIRWEYSIVLEHDINSHLRVASK